MSDAAQDTSASETVQVSSDALRAIQQKRAAARARKETMSNQNSTAAPAAQQTQQTLPQIATVPSEYMAQLEASRAEAAKFRQQAEETAKAAADMKAAMAKFEEQIKATEAEKRALAEESRSQKIKSAARMAAMEHGAIDPDDVVSLIGSKLTLDEAGAVIAADDTKAKVSDVVKGFLTAKPHLAKPRVQPGSGQSPYVGNAPAPMPPQQFDTRTREGATSQLAANLFARFPSLQTPPGTNGQRG